MIIGTEERVFVPRLQRLTVTQLPCCAGSTAGTEHTS